MKLLLSVALEVADTGDTRGFIRRMLASTRRLIPCSIISYQIVEPRSGRIVTYSEPEALQTGEEGILERHIEDHPFARHYRSRGGSEVVKVSDFLTTPQFHRLVLYQGIYRPHRIEHQLVCWMNPTPEQQMILTLHRDQPDFSERDRLLLGLLRPHLLSAHRSLQITGVIQRGLQAGRQVVLGLSRDGQIVSSTGPAACWLEAYFPTAIRPASLLPPALRDWVRAQTAGRAHDQIPMPVKPWRVDGTRGCLSVRFIPASEAGEWDVLVLEEQRELVAASVTPLGLSQREAEVLVLVAQGQTNPEIAQLLGVSPRTVQSHVEHVCVKLGVNTRTAAAARATALARQGDV